MSDCYFTIFTPTYNRAYKLSAAYGSLKRQKFSDFEWLIIDDGSTDGTSSLVESFIGEGIIHIKYLKKENEGKHIAINVGAEMAKGKWFFFLDSDDRLADDALEITKQYCEQVDRDTSFAGVAGLRASSTGEVWFTGDIKGLEKNEVINENKSDVMKKEYVDATPVEYRHKLKIMGDRAEVIKTDVLKKYKFPKFEGENFMSESFLWHSMSQDSLRIRWFNKVTYITEYLDDGLTKNASQLIKKNCRSRAFVNNIAVGTDGIPLWDKFKECVSYFRYGKYSGDSYSTLYKAVNNRLMGIISIPVAAIFKIKDDN